MSRSEPTYIGDVQSVSGGVVSVRLCESLASSLVLVNGESYRVGQVGAFLRIPLGYTNLYGVCSQVGAAAIPPSANVDAERANRWLSLTLFGESITSHFDRGVSQYPTVGDEVHLVTTDDLEVIYSSLETPATVNLGALAASSGIAGKINLAKLVARHCAVLGSTGSGKSNFVAVLLESIASQGFPSARVVIVDPHGEYGTTLGNNGYVFKVAPEKPGDKQLEVPFWALPFDELRPIVIGPVPQAANETVFREHILAAKATSAAKLDPHPTDSAISADTPVFFDLRETWFALDQAERMTYEDSQRTQSTTPIEPGSAKDLRQTKYPSHSMGNSAPYAPKPRSIGKNLELLRSRILDRNYHFLFTDLFRAETEEFRDLDQLVADWVGHDRIITVLDLSGVPSEILGTITGTLLRVIYDTLFWARDLPISGKKQPLLVILEEAHLFLPKEGESPAHRTIRKIAKEGRKYGVGLTVVTQRPTEIDPTILSQCGTMVALRLTNSGDRSVVSAAMPDDLGNLAAIIPSLRTGEALVLGEAMPIPSRIIFRRAVNKPSGGDPDLGKSWQTTQRPDSSNYKQAVANWRSQRSL